jgi:hypothetical protein
MIDAYGILSELDTRAHERGTIKEQMSFFDFVAL